MQPAAGPSPAPAPARASPGRPAPATLAPRPDPDPAPAAAQTGVEAPGAAMPAVEDPDARFRPRVRTAAERSSVDPGQAVRVIATLTDLEGNPVVTDLTAFGSQSRYRSGYIRRGPSRYSLFTSVRQAREVLWVTVSLGSGFAPASSGTVPLVSGGTGKVALPDGQIVTVTATLRPETAEEMAEGARLQRDEPPPAARLQRARFVRFALDPFRCGRGGAVC